VKSYVNEGDPGSCIAELARAWKHQFSCDANIMLRGVSKMLTRAALEVTLKPAGARIVDIGSAMYE
jgi:hypothetical protein